MSDAELLRRCLRYDPATGEFLRLTGPRAGKPAGGLDLHGYRQVAFMRKLHKAHRLAWLYVHGEWPDRHIDHINGDKLDNRIANLRLATPAENGQNRNRMNRNNTSGLPGATLHKQSGRWMAQITHQRRHIYLGCFGTAEEAHRAYLDAKRALHPFSPQPQVAEEVPA